MTYTEKALQLRPVMEQAAQSLEDATALNAKELFPFWQQLVESGATVDNGFRFRHDGQLWRTEQPKYTFVAHYVPGEPGLESLFSKVDDVHSGTLEDPIPYNGNMRIHAGLYYIQNGVKYLCTLDSGIPLYNDLANLVGLYVEVVK